MNTPTPRTDAVEVWNGSVLCGSANLGFARTLERELTHAREINAGSEANVAFLRAELDRERAKVWTLRGAMADVREYIRPGWLPNETHNAMVRALAATEDAKP